MLVRFKALEFRAELMLKTELDLKTRAQLVDTLDLLKELLRTTNEENLNPKLMQTLSELYHFLEPEDSNLDMKSNKKLGISGLIQALEKIGAITRSHYPLEYEKYALCKCREMLSNIKYPTENLNTDLIVKKLCDMSNNLGLQFYLSASTSSTSVQTATICGVIFVIDIDINQSGAVEKLTLSYATDTIPISQNINNLLVNLIRGGNYNDFKEELEYIGVQDSVSGFGLVHNMINSIKSHLTSFENKEADLAANINHGMGVPMMDFRKLGFSLTYFIQPPVFSEIKRKHQELSKLYLNEIERKHLELFTPNEICLAHLRLAKRNSTERVNKSQVNYPDSNNPQPTKDQIIFMLQINPPCLAPKAAVLEMANRAGIQSEINDFETLTTHPTFGTKKTHDYIEQICLKIGGTRKILENLLYIKSKGRVLDKYLVPDSIKPNACKIEFIPFNRSEQIVTILKYLRRFSAFEFLLMSFMDMKNSHIPSTETREKISNVTVKEVVPLEKIVLEFEFPGNDNPLVLMNVSALEDNSVTDTGYGNLHVKCVFPASDGHKTLSSSVWDRYISEYLDIPGLVYLVGSSVQYCNNNPVLEQRFT